MYTLDDTSTGNNISHINMIQLLHMLTHTSCIFLYTLCPNLEIEIIKKKTQIHDWTFRGAGRVKRSKSKWMIHVYIYIYMALIYFISLDWNKMKPMKFVIFYFNPMSEYC